MPISDASRADFNFEICLHRRDGGNQLNASAEGLEVCAGMFLGDIDGSNESEGVIINVPVSPRQASIEGEEVLLWKVNMIKLRELSPDAGSLGQICNNLLTENKPRTDEGERSDASGPPAKKQKTDNSSSSSSSSSSSDEDSVSSEDTSDTFGYKGINVCSRKMAEMHSESVEELTGLSEQKRAEMVKLVRTKIVNSMKRDLIKISGVMRAEKKYSELNDLMGKAVAVARQLYSLSSAEKALQS